DCPDLSIARSTHVARTLASLSAFRARSRSSRPRTVSRSNEAWLGMLTNPDSYQDMASAISQTGPTSVRLQPPGEGELRRPQTLRRISDDYHNEYQGNRERKIWAG